MIEEEKKVETPAEPVTEPTPEPAKPADEVA
jgi:hypothetical protein